MALSANTSWPAIASAAAASAPSAWCRRRSPQPDQAGVAFCWMIARSANG
jgi:hypothetical protein